MAARRANSNKISHCNTYSHKSSPLSSDEYTLNNISRQYQRPLPLGSSMSYIVLLIDPTIAGSEILRTKALHFYGINEGSAAVEFFDLVLSRYDGQKKFENKKIGVWEMLAFNSVLFLKPNCIKSLERIFFVVRSISAAVNDLVDLEEIIMLFRAMEASLNDENIDTYSGANFLPNCDFKNQNYEDFFFSCLADLQRLFLTSYFLREGSSDTLQNRRFSIVDSNFLAASLVEILDTARGCSWAIEYIHSQKIGVQGLCCRTPS